MQKLIYKVSNTNTQDAQVTLNYFQRTKSRLRTQLDSGDELGIHLPHGSSLKHGDLLQSEDGYTVQVVAALETVSTVNCNDALLLSRVCYHLGNRHVPIQIELNRVRYLHDHVLDEMILGLGLEVVVEQATFEPESGAYSHGGHSHSHD